MLTLTRLALSVLFCSLMLAPATSSASATTDIPWVWHSSAAPADAKQIGLLLDHLVISSTGIKLRRRMNRLVVAPGVQVTPVVHVQVDLAATPVLGQQHTDAINKAMLAAARRSSTGWIQLDFEAMESQKPYYLELVNGLKKSLPANIKLSVTTMAAWCSEPELLARIKADEIVPMFFKMGSNASRYQDRLIYHPEQLAPQCRDQAIGFSVQETPSSNVHQRYQRRYWFNDKNWHVDAVFMPSRPFFKGE
ncbi:hypothetical protein ACO0LG_23805 [Undibacterium sp. Ji42W]|uniref:hypothetical protein n=1 Tax=Undibacterium sp. Ji42W TaxID=3413039 RepID=UPI003BF3B63B